MSTFTVTLGGKQFEIVTPPIRKAQAWRQQLAVPLNEIVEIITTLPALQLENTGDLVKVVGSIKAVLLGSIDKISELLFSYSPLLEANKDFILDTATDEEAIDAMIEVVKHAYPLGRLAAILPTGVDGLPNLTTSKNSSAPNGASGSTTPAKATAPA